MFNRSPQGEEAMKRLSTKTIQSYDCIQLAEHLDKLMSKFDVAPYRVSLTYLLLDEYCEIDESYHFLDVIHSEQKDLLLECIDTAWRTLERRTNND
tara:strand:+ start:580 stop:867 length:288 start_codon:yes stop_codon:yes gene_type:complete